MRSEEEEEEERVDLGVGLVGGWENIVRLLWQPE
jgi:hypothetical protein